MKKLSIIGSIVLGGFLLASCGTTTKTTNRINDDNMLKIGKAASASNQYKIIVGKDRIKPYTIGNEKNDRKRLKGLSLQEAKEKVLQEAVIANNCAIIAEPNYMYDMKGKKVIRITVVGYPGYYNFDKDEAK